jgi:hypothetical protein
MEAISTLLFDSVDVVRSLLKNDTQNVPAKQKSIFYGKILNLHINSV